LCPEVAGRPPEFRRHHTGYDSNDKRHPTRLRGWSYTPSSSMRKSRWPASRAAVVSP